MTPPVYSFSTVATILYQELPAVDCLNALFWNYTRTDIQRLQSRSSDFSYVWDTYLADKSGEDAFNEFWRCWMVKFSLDTKAIILDYALATYGREKREALQSARTLSRFLRDQDGA